MPAPHGEDAAVLVDVGQDRRPEELRFRHEADLPTQVEADEEVVHLAEVVGGEEQRPGLRHVLDAHRARPPEQEGRQRDEDADERVGPADAPARRGVELVEVLGRAVVLVHLWLHLGMIDCRPAGNRSLPPGHVAVTRRARAVRRGPAARALERPSPAREQRVPFVLVHARLVASRLAPHLPHPLGGSRPRWRCRPGRRRPSAVVSAISGTTTAAPSTSAWNCISQRLATAPPSALSSASALAARLLLGADRVDRLVGDRLERRPRQVGAAAAARQADDGAARVGVPVRRAEAGQGRHEVDAVVGLQRGGERLRLGGLARSPRARRAATAPRRR